MEPHDMYAPSLVFFPFFLSENHQKTPNQLINYILTPIGMRSYKSNTYSYYLPLKINTQLVPLL
jgi:hypothetical protein